MDFRKNLLDLYYYKNLQYKNTVIIILFTYFIGILVAFLTGNLSLMNLRDTVSVGIVSSIFFTTIVLFLKKFDYHINRIPKEFKKLL